MLQILIGDVMEQLPTLPDKSVQCVVTSPPYWGLRDYGTAKWEGGDEGCDHWEKVGGVKSSTLGLASGGHAMSDAARERSTTRSFVPYRESCRTCGATRIDNQIGLEKTPELYVEKMVAVFREVKRVLRDDGTVWCNLGDSYARMQENNVPQSKNLECIPPSGTGRIKNAGLKPKDLVGVPWRVAFALQADGWYLRSDIIWAKPNPMPESVTDRPTKSHEYIFLLSKQERYFFDQDAVREPITCERMRGSGPMTNPLNGDRNDSDQRGDYRLRTNGKHDKTDPQAAGRRIVEAVKTARANGAPHDNPFGVTRNIRSVWTLATQPYPDAHFATFPEELPKRCILAGSKAGDTVLDPFAGSGTTLKVALELGRQAIGIELNPAYGKMIDQQCQTTMGLQL